MRSNWSFQQGGGDTHWAHGFEVMFGTLAAAMPTYSTPYFGASGVRSDLAAPDEEGRYWNPFPDQGVTWWQAATDPDIETPGHPNVRYPLRVEMLYTDDGWWVGANDFQGDGNRYYKGGLRRQLVDLNYGGMANAECRVELVEMSGYEAPFVSRLYVFYHIRRLMGDAHLQTGVANYLRRRVMAGYTPLEWDESEKIYRAQERRMDTSFEGYTWLENGARYPQARLAMQAQLDDISRFYGKLEGAPSSRATQSRKALYSVYALALCADPSSLLPPDSERNFAPIVKPMMKYVVRPGERVFKKVIPQDLNEDTLAIWVKNLPQGAVFDSANLNIECKLGMDDEGFTCLLWWCRMVRLKQIPLSWS